MRVTGIFRLKSFLPQRLLLSQQVPPVVPCYEWTRKEIHKFIHIDHGTFTLLVFSVNSSMGRKCQKFYSRLAQISEKENLPSSISSNWIRTKVCFGLLISSLLCLRWSRTVCRKTVEFEIDVDVSHTVAIIYKLDDNHKTNIDTFEGGFFRILWADNLSSI